MLREFIEKQRAHYRRKMRTAASAVLIVATAFQGSISAACQEPVDEELIVDTQNSIFLQNAFGNSNVDEHIEDQVINDGDIFGGLVENSELHETTVDSAEIIYSTVSGGTLYDSEISDSSIGADMVIGGTISDSYVTGGELEDVISTGNDIEYETINDSTLSEDDIRHSDIKNSKLDQTSLTDSDIVSSEVVDSDAECSDFEQSTVIDSNLKNDKISGSLVGGGTMRDSVTEHSTIDGGNIIRSTISGNSIVKDTGSYKTVSGNSIEKSVIHESTASDRTINDSTVISSNVSRGTMDHAKVTDSEMDGVNVRKSTISGSTISRGSISGSTLLDDEASNTSINKSKIDKSSVSDSKIKDSQISGSTLKNNNGSNNKTFRSTLEGVIGVLENIAESIISDSSFEHSTIVGGSINNSVTNTSKVSDADVTGGEVISSTVSGSSFTNANVKDSYVLKDSVTDSNVGGGTLRDTTAENTVIDGGNIIRSKIIGNSVLKNTGTYATVSGNSVEKSYVIDSTATDRTFNGSTVITSNLINGVLNHTNVTDSSINGADVRRSTISGSTIVQGSISGSTLLEDNISDSIIKKSKVDNSDLSNSAISNSEVSGSALTGTSNTETKTVRSVLSGVIGFLEYAIEDTIIDSKLEDSAIIEGTIDNSTIVTSKVTDVKMTGGDISVSTISGSTLSGTETTNNNILRTVLDGIVSVGDTIKNSSVFKSIVNVVSAISTGFNGTSISKSTVRGGSISGNSVIDDSDLRDAEIANSSVSNTNINGSTLDNVVISNSTVSGSTLRNTTLENVTVSAIDGFMKITRQPEDVMASRYSVAHLDIDTTGEVLSYIWFYKPDGTSSWIDVGTGKSVSMAITSDITSGAYRCLLLDSNGNRQYSKAARLTVAEGKTIVIKAQPRNIVAFKNSDVVFTIDAEGDGLNYQWQWRNADETTWSDSLGNGQTLEKKARDIWDGRVFRCVLSDMNNDVVISEEATISIIDDASCAITGNPEDVSGEIGDTVTFSVSAIGAANYQWYYSYDGENWYISDLPGNKTAEITVLLDSDRIKCKYRCRVTALDGTTLDSAAASIEASESTTLGLWGELVPNAETEDGNYMYTGKAITPEVKVYDGDTPLENNKDYTVKYSNNTKAFTLSEDDAGFYDSKGKALSPAVTVTGKGNYSGKDTIDFKILPIDLSMANSDVYCDSLSVQYNNKEQKPKPVPYVGSKALKSGTDYETIYYDKATYSDIDMPGEAKSSVKEPGEYIARVKGKGNYTGIRDVKLTVIGDAAKLVSKLKFSRIGNQKYSAGEEIKPGITVKDGKKILREKTDSNPDDYDYEVRYENNRRAGTGYAIVIGNPLNGYSGSKRLSFKIVGTALSGAKFSGFPASFTYSGREITFDEGFRNNTIKVYPKGRTEALSMYDPATEEGDFTVSYSKNIIPGTATVTLSGVNGCTGSVKKTFKITPCSLNDAKVSVRLAAEGDVPYAKGGAKEPVVIIHGGKILVEGTDYTLSYKHNTKAGNTASVTVKGKGRYKDTYSRAITYNVVAQDISKLAIDAADKSYQNKANIYKTTLRITDTNGKALSAGTDYDKAIRYIYPEGATVTQKAGSSYNTVTREPGEEVQKDDIIPAFTKIRATVSGKNNYLGTASCDYRIVKASVSNAKVTAESRIYTGKEITLSENDITVKVSGKEVKAVDPETGDRNWEIVPGSYKNNVNKGNASFRIRGLGNYGGTKTVGFKITSKGFWWWWRN